MKRSVLMLSLCSMIIVAALAGRAQIAQAEEAGVVITFGAWGNDHDNEAFFFFF